MAPAAHHAPRAQRGSRSFATELRTGHDNTHACLPLLGLIKKSRSGAMLERTPGIHADLGGVLAATGTGNVMGGATVRSRDQAAKLHGVAGNGCVTRDRCPAGTIKCREKRAFAGNRYRGV